MLTLEEKRLARNEKAKIHMRNIRKTEEGYKLSIISKWKYHKLIGDYDAIYERYKNTTNCDLCKALLTKYRKGGRQKQMEHNHFNGEFRNIVCHTCNVGKTDRAKPRDNTSGYKNIHYNVCSSAWVYKKNWKGKRISIQRKNKIEILCIKFASIILYRY
tara:strand:- start:188 stop:664 length:477 start_codon:yes stop_codon:yes gene_type:complete